MFVHLLDIQVRVSRMWEVHNDQFDLVMIARDCRGDHPFADVFCLNDQFANSVFLSESSCTPKTIYIYIYIYTYVY